jgi:hypothetical protein
MGRQFTKEAKVHVKAGTFDIESKADPRAVGDSLTLGTQADGTIEVFWDFHINRYAKYGSL